MNTALFHAARPGDIGGGGVGTPRVGMREAAGMARQMGFGKEEVANAWKMLDDLAETDSAAYKEIQEAAADHLRCNKAAGQHFFTPDPGFVVKSSLVQPYHESVLCGDRGSGCSPRKVYESAPSGTKVFINICCHEGVPPPKDLSDRVVDVNSEGRNASGLRMPMYCSRVRETVDHKEERCLAVDVAFHPWVIRSSRSEWRFRDQVVNLAAGWIMKEHPGLVLNSRQRKLLKLITYKGGRGPQGLTPLPFSVDEANAQNIAPEARSNSDAGNRRTRDDGSYSGSHGGRSLLDESMKDPESFLTARRKFSSTTTEARDGGGDILSRIPDPDKSSQREGRDIGAEELLGVSNRAAGAPRGKKAGSIRLPEGLAGIADAGNDDGDGGGGKGEHTARTPRKKRGPLISEISSPIARGKEEKKFDQKGYDNNVQRGTAARVEGRNARKLRELRRRKPVVKKGFLEKLNGKASPLYPPEGSENGTDEAPMMRLMRKSKVVDTRDLSKQELEAAMRAHAGVKALSPRLQQNAPEKPPGSSSKKRKDSAVKKGFLETGKGGALYGDEGSREGAGGRRPGQWNDPEFERLVAMADPEMEPKKTKEEDEDPLAEQLAQLAKVLGPHTTGSAPRDSDATTYSQAESTVVSLPHPPGPEELATQNDKQQHEQDESAGNDQKEGRAVSNTETRGCSHDKVHGVGVKEGSIEIPAPVIKTPIVSQQDHDVDFTGASPLECADTAVVKERKAVTIEKVEVTEKVMPDDVARLNERHGLSREGAQIKNRDGEVEVQDPSEGPPVVMADPGLTAATAVESKHAGQVPVAPRRADDSSTQSHIMNENGDGNTITTTVLLFPEQQTLKSSTEKALLNEPSQRTEDGPMNSNENEMLGNAAAGKAREVTGPKPCREEREPTYRIEECVLPQSGAKSNGTAEPTTGDRRRGVVVVVNLPDVASADRQWDEGTDTGSDRNHSSRHGQRRKFSLRDVELDVFSDSLAMRVPGLYRLHLQLPFPVDNDDVTAKFSKVRSTLTISAGQA